MNKAIYICAAMALMLASCSNDETVEQAKEKGISFRGTVGLSTRALNTGTAELLDGKVLYVTTFKPNGERLFVETEYVFDGDVWMAQPAQTWGVNDKLSFFLTYPKLDEWQTGFELTNDNKTVTVTVDEDIPQQKDYVAAYLENMDKTTSAMRADLRHVLSSVEIWAKNTNGAFKYKVKGIRICGVNEDATIDLSTLNEDNFTVGNGSQKRNYELRYNTPVTLGSKAQSIMDKDESKNATNAILPPQTGGTAWNGSETSATAGDYVGSYISVLINLTAMAGANIYPAGSTADNETYGWVSVPVAFKWESGKKYVYTLDFSDGAGQVDPTDPGDAVIPDDNVDPAKAKPVLGGLIKFGLKVTEWNKDDKNVDLKDGDKFGVTVDEWEDETNDATVK